ncbi:hypothetical protein FDUTEX481_07020 [Tolypothrix sp. PCC 7601]|nr:hypothetical protein FDUTEX481_07020 [Tolypothrix sp. PCC 7601]
MSPSSSSSPQSPVPNHQSPIPSPSSPAPRRMSNDSALVTLKTEYFAIFRLRFLEELNYLCKFLSVSCRFYCYSPQ